MLIDSADSVVKLANFGLSREIDLHLRSLTMQVGNIDNMAPEVLLGSDKYSTPSDIWAVGCVFVEIVMGRHLFGGRCCPNELLCNICRILGTPNEQMWPGVTSLFSDFSRVPKFPPKNLAEVVKGLEPAGINLLSVSSSIFKFNTASIPVSLFNTFLQTSASGISSFSIMQQGVNSALATEEDR